MTQANDYNKSFEWRFLHPRYWMTWFGLLMLWILSYFPVRARRFLCDLFAKLVYRQNAKRRNIVETNFSLTFPELDATQRKEMALHFISNALFIFLDYPLLFWATEKTVSKRIRIEGLEHIKACQDNNRPVILLTCHMLALEYGALALTKHSRTVGLIKPARNDLFEWLITQGRKRYTGQLELYLRDKGIRPVIRAIKKHSTFYYLPDEDLGEKTKTEFVPFFGVEAATLTALSPMVAMTRAAVLPAAAVLDEKTGVYTLQVDAPLEEFPGDDEIEDMKRMNLILEELIRRAPTQYMWSLRLFQNRPHGEPSPYKTF